MSVLVGALLFYSYSASAATLAEKQLIFTDGGALDGSEASANQGVGLLSPGAITDISYYLSWNGTGSAPSVSARLYCSNTNTYGAADCGQTDSVAQTISGTSATLYTFHFASPITINTAKYYAIGLNFTGSGGAQIKYYGSATNAWRGTTTETKCFSAGICGTLADIYFYFTVNAVNGISITYPVSGSTGLGNFGLWKLNYGITTSTNAFINVFVNTTSTVSQANYLWYDQEPATGDAGTYSTVMNRLDINRYASGTTYYAKAYLYSNTAGGATVLAESAVVSFDIGDVDSDFVFEPVDAPFLLGTGGGESSVLCSKAPFAYWCDFTDIINTLTATTTSSSIPTLSISIPSVNGGASTSIDIISKTGVENTIGSGTVALMRNLILYGLYIAAGLYVWERIKHFKFH